MDISIFTISLTDDCNYNCKYCYQKRGTLYLNTDTIREALDFFHPFFSQRCRINFYGGEPLLSFPAVSWTVNYLHELTDQKHKTFDYTITTNGSLIKEEILDFFENHAFRVMLSFDGISQNRSREAGSLNDFPSIVDRLKSRNNINLQTNSVFTPATIADFSRSIEYILALGIEDILFSLSINSKWEIGDLEKFKRELNLVADRMIEYHKTNGRIPLEALRSIDRNGDGYACSAGHDRLSLAANGTIWGCHLFADYFSDQLESPEYKQYCFGRLAELIKEYTVTFPAVLKNYSFPVDHFSKGEEFCMFCHAAHECQLCPITCRLNSRNMLEVPEWLCSYKNILCNTRKKLWLELETLQ